MVKTRSGLTYKYVSQSEVKAAVQQKLIYINKLMKQQKEIVDLKLEIEKFEKKKEKIRDTYIEVLSQLVDRRVNHRISIFVMKNLKKEKFSCPVCYEDKEISLTCKNGHCVCNNCTGEWLWNRACVAQKASTATCPICRESYLDKTNDELCTLAGITFTHNTIRFD